MTLCEIAPASLQFDQAYCVPAAPFCGLGTVTGWLDPCAQKKICGVVNGCPSTVKASPDGFVVTIVCTLKLAVTERGAPITTDCGLVAPDKSPVKFEN